VLKAVDGGKYIVKSVKKSLSKQKPSAPFTTSTMQQDALNKLGLTMKKVTSCAQELYEGVTLGDEGKVALITGAARGIGKAIAIKYAQEGANIAFTDLVIDENGENTKKEIESYGVKVLAIASNAASFEEAHNAVEQVVKEFGKLDILVNNAGITKDGLMMRMSEAQWDAVIAVNLKSAFNFVHAVTPVMVRQRGGSIINMSSVVGVHGNAGQCNYSASKAGMIGLAKSIAQELGSRGVRANAIAPGFIITEMTAQLPDEVKKEWASKIPLRRGGTPEDIANVATFLASDLSSYVTGQVISVCGGMQM
jgi:3-oxoacyl-[acyl-carrier protein] reductase